MRAWIHVATLIKLRNPKGRFVARAAAGLPFLLEPGDEVALVPPATDVPRSLTVKDVVLAANGDADVEFSEGLSIDQIQALVGMRCLMRRSLISDEEFADAPGAWEGWKVVCEVHGELGNVMGLIDNPAQALLQVERADGAGELLIPVVDEIVRNVDARAQEILVRLPQGLLEL